MLLFIRFLGRYQRTWANAFCIAAIAATAVPALAADEVRGVWCSRFQWGSDVPATAQANLLNTMNGAQAGNFNAVFLQSRGQCDVLYPSPYEPWSPIVSNPDGANPGWDPMAFSVYAAHARGLQLHAYFNTHTIWGSATPPSTTNYPTHIMNVHPEWQLHNGSGGIPAFSEYRYMNPGIPEADAWVRLQAAYLVANYDIDGLHFDRVRMTEPGYGKNPLVINRWDNPSTPAPNDGTGNPENLGWDAFMRDCVTRQVMNMYGQTFRMKPWVALSSAPLGLWDYSAYATLGGYSTTFHYGYRRGQDAKAWMQMGAQDFIVPQIYWNNGGTKPDFNEVFDDWLAAGDLHGRGVVPASNMSNGHEEVTSHALYARSQGELGKNSLGHNIWHSGNTLFSSWSAPGAPYEVPANFPALPWKAAEGAITGNVYADACQTTAAVDAWITRTGSSWTALSSGDGFFSFLRVAPGTYTVTVNHPSLGTINVPSVVVTAGKATHITVAPGSIADAPTNLTASIRPGLTTVALSWNDNATSESGYEIYRATQPDGPFTKLATVAANITAYVDDAVLYVTDNTWNGSFYYQVRAGSSCTATGSNIAAAALTWVPDMIIESRNWSGGSGDMYGEVASAGAAFGNTTAKSLVTGPRVRASGSRWTGNSSDNSYADFIPRILVNANYEVMVTGPNAVNGLNVHSPGTVLDVRNGATVVETRTYDNSRFNTALTDQWMSLSPPLIMEFPAGKARTIRLTNTHDASANSGNRFNVDSIRLRFVSNVPVGVSTWSVE